MHDDEYTPEERRLFEALPRESEPPSEEEERLVARLRAEGFFRRRWRHAAALGVAAAAALFIGMIVGTQLADANSIESQIAREQLSPSAARALLERARANYERARERYTIVVGVSPAPAEPHTSERTEKEPVRTAGVLWF